MWKTMSNKIVAIFVEGDTEIEFYKAVVQQIRQKTNKPFSCSFEWINMRGVGNYKNDAQRKYLKIKKDNPDADIYVFMCIDTDVFELAKKPPIDKAHLKHIFESLEAKQVCYIEAKHSIEDWFLCDFAGVLNFLHLPKSTKKPTTNGQDALKKLFKNANKVYVKGSKIEGFISKLDIPLIMKCCCNSLKPLCQVLDVDCSIICRN